MSPISRNRPPASAVAERTIRSGTERKYSDICFRRTRSVQADLFARLEGERYDLILANPPYVSAAALRRLPPEYRYEPGLALAAGRDGLDLVARILAEAPAQLAKAGLLVCEVGEGRKALERRFAQAPLLWPQEEVFILPQKMG